MAHRSNSLEVKEFDEFVKRQQNGVGEGQFDWDRERDEWLAHLDDLYRKIETMLSGYTSSGQISVRYKTIDLNEEDIGSYQARKMILRIGRQEVDILPAGTRFIGFKGYVEVIGSARKLSLVLANKDRFSTLPKVTVRILTGGMPQGENAEPPVKIEWVWKILPRPPERQLVELTQESFFQLLMEVTNG
jgi:hypothetical protein